MNRLKHFLTAVFVLWAADRILRPRHTVQIIEAMGKSFSDMMGATYAAVKVRDPSAVDKLMAMGTEGQRELYSFLVDDDLKWLEGLLREADLH